MIMRDVPDALLPVGRDCDCGHPLVWRSGRHWCAVYGSHLAPTPSDPPRPLTFRNRHAPLAAVVDLLASAS